MFHFQANKLLTAYLDNELSGKQKLRFERHLQSCKKCQVELVDYKKLNSLLESTPSEESRAEYYWQSQKKAILQKAQQPEIIQSPLFTPAKRKFSWQMATLGSTAIVIVLIVVLNFKTNFFDIFHAPVNTPKDQAGELGGLENYYVDQSKLPKEERLKKAPLTSSKPADKEQVDEKLKSLSTRQPKSTGEEKTRDLKNESLLGLGYINNSPKAAPPALGESPEKKAEASTAFKDSLEKKIEPVERRKLAASSPAKSLDNSSVISLYGEGYKITNTDSPKQEPQVNFAYRSLSDLNKDTINLLLYDRSRIVAGDTSTMGGFGGGSAQMAKAAPRKDADSIAGAPTSGNRSDDKLALGRLEEAKKKEVVQQLASIEQERSGSVYGKAGAFDLFLSIQTVVLVQTPLTQALDTIARVYNTKIIVISPPENTKITLTIKTTDVYSTLQAVGNQIHHPYLYQQGKTYVLTPDPFDWYTDKKGFASDTNKILYINYQLELDSVKGQLLMPSNLLPLCPVCKKIELEPNWTYCPIDGHQIDKSIFKK